MSEGPIKASQDERAHKPLIVAAPDEEPRLLLAAEGPAYPIDRGTRGASADEFRMVGRLPE